mmetsp:Transcript_124652/g.360618  ORF Transcript_124652/g.360618 Transcript_124652/m.360618 type:complete len:284 (+) Transcript_124652:318-1169(+)
MPMASGGSASVAGGSSLAAVTRPQSEDSSRRCVWRNSSKRQSLKTPAGIDFTARGSAGSASALQMKVFRIRSPLGSNAHGPGDPLRSDAHVEAPELHSPRRSSVAGGRAGDESGDGHTAADEGCRACLKRCRRRSPPKPKLSQQSSGYCSAIRFASFRCSALSCGSSRPVREGSLVNSSMAACRSDMSSATIAGAAGHGATDLSLRSNSRRSAPEPMLSHRKPRCSTSCLACRRCPVVRWGNCMASRSAAAMKSLMAISRQKGVAISASHIAHMAISRRLGGC